jgi:hypothetical protein
MRHIRTAVGLTLLLLAGCRPLPSPGPVGPGPAIGPSDAPTAETLVGYLNANAQRLHSLDCGKLELDCRQGRQPFGLEGWVVAQKPKNFRMAAKILGKQAVDMGSNDHEFWYWISEAKPPYLFHCSYEDFAQGNARMPMPFQPEWIMEALGMAEYGPPEKYQVTPRGNVVELVEATTNAQGQTVSKVTVFTRSAARGGAAQVTAHLLRDAGGKEICGAYITEVQQERTSGAILPYKLRLVWPAEQLEMKMTLNGCTANAQFEPQRAARLFNRPQMPNVPTYDLARGPDHRPASAILRTGGVMRR